MVTSDNRRVYELSRSDFAKVYGRVMNDAALAKYAELAARQAEATDPVRAPGYPADKARALWQGARDGCQDLIAERAAPGPPQIRALIDMETVPQRRRDWE